MAKLAAALSWTVWLIVALAAIVRLTQATGCFSILHRTKNCDKDSDGDWKALSKACAKEISKNIGLKGEEQWLLSSVASKETDCAEDRRRRVPEILARGKTEGYEKCFKLMSDYLPIYLNECDHESRFAKVINFIKEKSLDHFSFANHQTLKSYFNERILPLDDRPAIVNKMIDVFSAIENFAELERISKQADCSLKLQKYLVTSLVKPGDKRPELHEFRQASFALYLDKCGFEEFFNERIEHMKQSSHLHWDSVKYPTLFSSISMILSENESKGENAMIKLLNQILSHIREFAALENISKETQCNDSLKNRLLNEVASKTWRQPLLQELIKDYLALYLERCGFTRRFKTAIDNMSQEFWDSDQCPTLESYLEVEIWPQMMGYQSIKPPELNQVISIIKELSELNSISKETECTEKVRDTFLMSHQSIVKFPRMHKLADGYFALYLKSCGFEDQFRKSIDNIKQISHEPQDPVTQPTLYSSLKGKIVKGAQLAWVLPAIKQLSALQDTDCSAELLDSLLSWVKKSSHLYPELHSLFGKYLARYLDKCGQEQLFNNRIEHMKQSSHEDWDSEKTPSLYSLIMVARKQEALSMMAAIAKLSAVENISKDADCNDQLQGSLLKRLFADSYGEDFRIIVKDYFSLYLEKCGFEDSFKKRIANIKRGVPGKWDPEANPTLYSLIKNKFWRKDVLVWVLPILKRLSGLDDISKQPDCSEKLRLNFLDWLVTNKKENRDLNLLIKSYFALYLTKCGSDEGLTDKIDDEEEDSFMKALDKIFAD